MHRLSRLLGATLLICTGLTSICQEPPSDAALHAAHNALFAAFLPVDDLPRDAKTTALLKAARDGMWEGVRTAPALRELLAPFTDLRAFGKECGIDSTLAGTKETAFADLPRGKRDSVLSKMQSCEVNRDSRLAATVRNFYVVKGYAAVQTPLTGVNLNLFAPPDYLKTHMPKLAPSRLVYDSIRHELAEKDGHVVDVLIVGSGPAGSVLAHELRQNGQRVLLVERGSFVIPGSMETRLVDDLIDTRTTTDGTIRVRNGMGVGGGSQVNVDLCFAPTSDAIRTKIEGWRKVGRIGPNQFTQEELQREYQWVKRSVGTRTLTEDEINANNHALWDGAKAYGLHPKLYALNTWAPGQSPSPVTDKRSAESELLIAALEDEGNPLGMLPDAEVRRVIFEDGTHKAVGVEVQARAPIPEAGAIADPNGLNLSAGEVFTIHAKNVILSAGALGSPTILLRSGMKNDNIGRGIVLHPSMPIMGRFERTIDALRGTEASVYVDDHLIDRGYAMESMADQPVYAAIMSPGPPLHSLEMVRAFRELAGFGVMLIDTPQLENRLTLDERGNPEIHYGLSADDKQRLAEGIGEAIRVMFKGGAKEVYLPTTENILGKNSGSSEAFQPQVLTSPEQATIVEENLKFLANRSMVTSAHMQGTNKMSAGESDGVVAQDFHAWGTENLFVVDGSIFPTSVGANPMQTIYTIAKIFADHWNAQQTKATSSMRLR